MPHYPSKPAKELLADMINEANGTNYTAVQFEVAGAPTSYTDAAGRNTRLPVTFNFGRLADGALTEVHYKRLSLDDLFGAMAVTFNDTGAYVNTADLLPKLFELYGVVLTADDVVNSALNLSAHPATVTVQANPNSLAFTGQFDIVLTVPTLNWQEPIDGEAVQLFEGISVSPFRGDWFIDTTWSSEGAQSLRSANIGNNQTSSTDIDISDGTGLKLAFDYKVSTELNYDFLRLFVNGVQAWQLSGDTTGTHVIALPAGPVNVEWRFVKDETDDGNLDSCWIDRVRIFAPVAMTSGILVSHLGGTQWTSDLTNYNVCDDADKPTMWNSAFATWAANGPNEIIAVDGFSSRIDIHASYDGTINWIKRQNTNLKLASNESTFFKGNYYFLGQDRTNSEYGLYRLDRTGSGEAATFTATRVVQLTTGGAVLAANADNMAVFDGALRYTSDGTTWNTQSISHPYATGGVGATMYRMGLAFLGSDIVGLGQVNSVDPSAPSMAMFIGTLGGVYTWKQVNPYGVGVKANPTQKLLKAIDGNKLILAVSEPQNGSGGYVSSGDIILGTNAGDNWAVVASNTGIYPMSIADDGTYLMVTGFRQRAGQYHWQAQSQDRGASWQYDTNESSFFGTNQSDYTFALGIPPVTP